MSWYLTKLASISDADIISGFDVDQDNWTCDNWKVYYTRIKAKYGQQKASDTIQLDVGNAGFFANVNNCKYDCDFVNFFDGEGITGGNIFSKLYCGTSNAVSSVAGAVDNVAQTASFVTSPVILIGALVTIGYIYYGRKRK